jgi:hypothetical protein
MNCKMPGKGVLGVGSFERGFLHFKIGMILRIVEREQASMQIATGKIIGIVLAASILAAGVATMRAGTRHVRDAAPRPGEKSEASESSDIGGIVTSSHGPEAGVWVIAETSDLGTKFRKIVVTNDRGQYLLPGLPKANYKLWVRGYGLVDSEPVDATPGSALPLTAVVAPDSSAAAQYYPASYWVSLLNVPPKSAFPMTVPSSPPIIIPTQADWLYTVKGCWGCHQMGGKATRQIPPSLGKFDSSAQAWARFISSGQLGRQMNGMLSQMGHEEGVALFADWVDRIAKGELPPVPSRPQGTERNVVVTVWDWSVRAAFPYAAISTDKRDPSVNAYGPVYGGDWFASALAVVDPVKNTKAMIDIALPSEEDRKRLPSWAPQTQTAPSVYFGDELIWNGPLNPGSMAMDSKARVWFNVKNRPENPAYCKESSGNAFAKYAPRESGNKGIGVYDPRTRKFEFVDQCVTTEHIVFAADKDQTLYASTKEGGIAWVNTRVWDETHDSEKSTGWCPAVIDYNRDGKLGPYTTAPEPLDPKLDRAISNPLGDMIAYNPADGSIWYTALNPRPGRLIRMVKGANPPSTCNAEVYEVPYDPKGSGNGGSHPRGIDIDSKGIVWTPLAGEGILASFDRGKCKVRAGEAATIGRHCPEGWSFHPIPGAAFKTQPEVRTDFAYAMWVDRSNTLGLGKDLPVVSGADSDSLQVFNPATNNWVRLRVPYPMGFFARFLDGRIDDAKAGWKGRGLWAANETTGSQLTEGGKNMPSQVAHFQIRPDPLAK